MRVRAIAPGFYDIHKNHHPIDIKVGQEFDIPDGAKLGRWMAKVEPAKPAEPEKPPQKPAPAK